MSLAGELIINIKFKGRKKLSVVYISMHVLRYILGNIILSRVDHGPMYEKYEGSFFSSIFLQFCGIKNKIYLNYTKIVNYTQIMQCFITFDLFFISFPTSYYMRIPLPPKIIFFILFILFASDKANKYVIPYIQTCLY